jgi:O-antigen/teichoic acid export membrane protein
VKQLVKNIATVGAADAGVRLIGFATTAYLGRVLGSEGFGLLGMGLAVAGYLFLIASPGIHIAGTRDVAAKRGDEGELVSTVLSIRMVLAPALFLIAVVVVLLGGSDRTATLTLIAAAAAILPMAFSFDWFFQGKEQFDLYSAQKLISAVGFLAASLLLVKGSGDAALAAAAFGAGAVGASVFSYFGYRRYARFRFSWDPPVWRRMLEGSYPLALSALLGQTATSFPILVAGVMLSAGDAGQMNAATKLILLALIMDRVFVTLFLPALARAVDEGDQARIIRLGLRIMLAIAVPIAIAGWVLAPSLMTFVFGGGFAPAVAPFRILLIYLAMTLINSVFVAAFIVARRERQYFSIMLIGSLVTAAVAITATPLAGIEGTAAAVSAGEVAMTFLFIHVLRSNSVLGNGRDLVPLLAAALGMAAVTGGLSAFSVPLAIGGGLVLYAVAVAAMKGFTSDDAHLLREVVG